MIFQHIADIVLKSAWGTDSCPFSQHDPNDYISQGFYNKQAKGTKDRTGLVSSTEEDYGLLCAICVLHVLKESHSPGLEQ